MKRGLLALAGIMLLACGSRPDPYAGADTTGGRDIQLPAADTTVAINDRPAAPPAAPTTPPRGTPAPPPPAAQPEPAPPPAPAARSAAQLAAGTAFEATATREISSRTNKPGEQFTARIGEAVRAADGRVVIPAGSEVTLSIVDLKPAPNKGAKDGTLVVRAVSITIDGRSQPLDADVVSVEHQLKGRGVGGREAAKVGVGAAAGAVIGRVIGGGAGAAAGAVTGAAAGAAVAVETADRDVVVPVGALVRLSLRAPLSAG
jgi:hypothetical protein